MGVRLLLVGRVLAAILFVSGLFLVLYPFWHVTVDGITAECGPSWLNFVPSDPGMGGHPPRASDERCYWLNWVHLVGGAGLIVGSTIIFGRVKRKERELSSDPGLPARPDPHVLPRPTWRERLLGPGRWTDNRR
jgi:hypothetical protein